MKAFEVTKEDIERLDRRSLPNLMKNLLRAELSKLKLKQSELIISRNYSPPPIGDADSEKSFACFLRSIDRRSLPQSISPNHMTEQQQSLEYKKSLLMAFQCG